VMILPPHDGLPGYSGLSRSFGTQDRSSDIVPVIPLKAYSYTSGLRSSARFRKSGMTHRQASRSSSLRRRGCGTPPPAPSGGWRAVDAGRRPVEVTGLGGGDAAHRRTHGRGRVCGRPPWFGSLVPLILQTPRPLVKRLVIGDHVRDETRSTATNPVHPTWARS